MQIPDATVLKSWPAPNYINPETRGPVAIIVVSVLLFLVTVILAVRIYTRLRISNGFGLDDILILLAYVPTIAFATVGFIAQVKFGWGTHVWDVHVELFTSSLKASLASQIIFDLSTSLTKLSIVALIWRVVSVDGSRYRYAVVGLAIVVATDGAVFFFLTLFQCSPPEAYWTLSVAPQQCIDEQKHLLAASCINTITDFLLVLLPIPSVSRLNLPRKQQIVVASLFAGGLFATAVGAARTYVSFNFFNPAEMDMTYDAPIIVILSALELHIGIICASIPAIKPFIARYFPHLLGNPIYWLSRDSSKRDTSHKRDTASPKRAASSNYSMLAGAINQSTNSFDRPLSSHPITQLRGTPPMPNMPTPLRPLRPLSSMTKSLSVHGPYNLNTKNFAVPISPSVSSNATASTTILSPSSWLNLNTSPVLGTPLNLNKPLPLVKSDSRLTWATMDEERDWGQLDERRNTPANMMSVYQMIAHEDGHISVHKTREHPSS